MTRSFPTLCSFALALWAHQTGLWILAIPMILAIEGRWILKMRWPAPSLQRLYSLSGLILLLAFSFVQASVDRAGLYAFVQCWPIGGFPFLLCQIYCADFAIFWNPWKHTALRSYQRQVPIAPIYLAICILGASAVNGNEILFLATTAGVFSSLLVFFQQRRFRLGVTNGLIVLAVVAGMIGGQYLQQLQGYVEKATEPLLNDVNGYAVDSYQSVTQVGKISSLKQSNEILFRVAPSLPSKDGRSPLFPMKLRDASYNRYRGGTWSSVNNEFTPIFPADQSLTRWSLAPTVEPSRSIRISDRLRGSTGILKLPMGTTEVHQLNVLHLQQNQFGAVKVYGSPGPVNYEAQFSPDNAFDGAPTPEDLVVPEIEQPALRNVLGQLQFDPQSDSEKVSAIQNFFGQNFRYSLELTAPQSGQTGIANFLLENRFGHCEYFASATTLLLREIGIPARYVVGYSAYEYSPLERQYVVRRRNAHAWVMAYMDGQWREVDTTPPDWTTIDDAQSDIWQRIGDFFAYLGYQLSRLMQNFNPLILLGLIAPFIIYVLWKSRRKKNPQVELPPVPEGTASLPGVDSEFYQVEELLQVLSLNRQPTELLAVWLDRVQPHLSETEIQALSEITRLHYRYRFDPAGLSSSERNHLASLCLELSTALQSKTPQNV